MGEKNQAVVDTNVILRHLLNDHPEHSPRASALMLRVRRGEVNVFCPDTAIFEAIHILHMRAKSPREKVAPVLSLLLESPCFEMQNKPAVLDALQLWEQQFPLDFADCYHLALTRYLGMMQIYTFDKKMDRYPGVDRIEP